MSNHEASVVVLEGIDGCGKSTAARAAAVILSGAYPTRRINVIDSDGVSSYFGGDFTDHWYNGLEKVKHLQSKHTVGRLGCLGAFTVGRRYIEKMGRQSPHSDLVISVRDPARISPAAYAPVVEPHILGRMSSAVRLKVLDRFTTLTPPDMTMLLRVEPTEALAAMEQRTECSQHENIDSLQRVSSEFDAILPVHTTMFGGSVLEVEALRSTTNADIAGKIEHLVDFPNAA